MANVRVDMLTLRTSDNTVLAASHGRGLFSCTFNIDLNTAVKETAIAENPFSIYAVTDGFQIFSNVKAVADFGVYNLSGAKVLSGNLEPGPVSHTIKTGELSRGVYLVKVKSGNQQLVKKIVL
jgi:hypothetical protein